MSLQTLYMEPSEKFTPVVLYQHNNTSLNGIEIWIEIYEVSVNKNALEDLIEGAPSA